MDAANMCRLSPDAATPACPRGAAEDLLAQRAGAGDAAALERLIAEFRPRVYSFALSQLRQREDAEDVTQEAFVRMVRGLGSYTGRGQFRAWLYRIVVNLCRDRQRRRSHDRQRTIPEQEVPEAAVAGDLQEEVSTALTLAAAISRLPDRYREVLTLCWLEQLSPAEIAAVLGRSVNAVRVQLWRGRALLVRDLGDWLDELPERASRRE